MPEVCASHHERYREAGRTLEYLQLDSSRLVVVENLGGSAEGGAGDVDNVDLTSGASVGCCYRVVKRRGGRRVEQVITRSEISCDEWWKLCQVTYSGVEVSAEYLRLNVSAGDKCALERHITTGNGGYKKKNAGNVDGWADDLEIAIIPPISYSHAWSICGRCGNGIRIARDREGN